jgi:hypothetical protein
MGISGGPDMIQDGLVLSLDASDRNSYVSGSSTWRDLASGFNATLANNPGFSASNLGSLIYSGSTWVYFNTNATFQALTNNFTILGWIKPTTQMTGARLFGPGYTSQWQMELRGGSGTRLSINYTSGSNQFQQNGPTVTFNQWQQVGFVMNNGAVNYIYNGSITATGAFNVGGNFVAGTNPYSVGNYGNSVDGAYYGEIANHTVYNRVLSAAEVLQNYNASKSRFNL